MARRSCANCGADEWIDYRYCADCWKAAGKGAAAAIGSGLALRLLVWLLS